MPFSRPTLSQLEDQISGDITTAIPGADPLLRFSNLGILGRALAAAINLLFGYLDWIARQAVPFTATGVFLEAWGALKGVSRTAAVAWAGTASFPWTSGTIDVGTALQTYGGTQYVTTDAASVVGSTITAPVQAVTPGSAAGLQVGNVINLSAPIAGITSTGAVASVTQAGVDVETDDAFRLRVLRAFAAPPQGGDQNDYVEWALAIAGVTRAWCVPLEGGAGTVSVYFMMDVVEAAYGGFPQGSNGVATDETRDTAATGDQLTVANAIYPQRPVTALVYAKAPGQNTVAFTLDGISGASTATKAAIAAAIAGVFLTYGSPGTVSGTGGVVDVSYIESAIAAIAGTAGFVITAESCTHGSVSPTDGNITSTAGYLPVAGTITYT